MSVASFSISVHPYLDHKNLKIYPLTDDLQEDIIHGSVLKYREIPCALIYE